MQRSWGRRLAGGSEGCMRLRQKAVGKIRKGSGWDALTLEDLVTYKDLCLYSWWKKSPFSPPCFKNLVPPPPPPHPSPSYAHTLFFSQPPCSSASQTWGTSGPPRGWNVQLLGPTPTPSVCGGAWEPTTLDRIPGDSSAAGTAPHFEKHGLVQQALSCFSTRLLRKACLDSWAAPTASFVRSKAKWKYSPPCSKSRTKRMIEGKV